MSVDAPESGHTTLLPSEPSEMPRVLAQTGTQPVWSNTIISPLDTEGSHLFHNLSDVQPLTVENPLEDGNQPTELSLWQEVSSEVPQSCTAVLHSQSSLKPVMEHDQNIWN